MAPARQRRSGLGHVGLMALTPAALRDTIDAGPPTKFLIALSVENGAAFPAPHQARRVHVSQEHPQAQQEQIPRTPFRDQHLALRPPLFLGTRRDVGKAHLDRHEVQARGVFATLNHGLQHRIGIGLQRLKSLARELLWHGGGGGVDYQPPWRDVRMGGVQKIPQLRLQTQPILRP